MTDDRPSNGHGDIHFLWLLAVAAGCLLTWAACAAVGTSTYRTCAAPSAAVIAPQPQACGSPG